MEKQSRYITYFSIEFGKKYIFIFSFLILGVDYLVVIVGHLHLKVFAVFLSQEIVEKDLQKKYHILQTSLFLKVILNHINVYYLLSHYKIRAGYVFSKKLSITKSYFIQKIFAKFFEVYKPPSYIKKGIFYNA